MRSIQEIIKAADSGQPLTPTESIMLTAYCNKKAEQVLEEDAPRVPNGITSTIGKGFNTVLGLASFTGAKIAEKAKDASEFVTTVREEYTERQKHDAIEGFMTELDALDGKLRRGKLTADEHSERKEELEGLIKSVRSTL
jgi:hypothetical protein